MRGNKKISKDLLEKIAVVLTILARIATIIYYIYKAFRD